MILGKKISILTSYDEWITGIATELVNVGDSCFLIIDDRLYNTGFIQEIKVHDIPPVCKFVLKPIP